MGQKLWIESAQKSLVGRPLLGHLQVLHLKTKTEAK